MVVVDVAHNPEAAATLGENLANSGSYDRTLAVFGMLGDKDIAGVIESVRQYIDLWLIADIQAHRGAPAHRLRRELSCAGIPDNSIVSFESPAHAYADAKRRARDGDRIVVFGSFHTVAAIMAVQEGDGTGEP